MHIIVRNAEGAQMELLANSEQPAQADSGDFDLNQLTARFLTRDDHQSEFAGTKATVMV